MKKLVVLIVLAMMRACEKESLVVDSEKDNNECIEKNNAQLGCWWQAYRNLENCKFQFVDICFSPQLLI